MNNGNIVREQWWLMDCSLPDLNWARLRVYSDGSATIFECDGKTFPYSNEEEAIIALTDDEYVEFDYLLEDKDKLDLTISLSSIKPPSAKNDEELLPQMLGDILPLSSSPPLPFIERLFASLYQGNFRVKRPLRCLAKLVVSALTQVFGDHSTVFGLRYPYQIVE